jgi:hypothetical protein
MYAYAIDQNVLAVLRRRAVSIQIDVTLIRLLLVLGCRTVHGIRMCMAIESDQLRKRKLFGQAALGAKQDPDQFIIFPQIKFEMQDIPL